MEDDEKPWKRRATPWDDLMRGLGVDPNQFERLFAEMQEALSRALSDVGPFEPGKPYMHGFSFKIGPDGKPTVQSFGNRPKRGPDNKKVVALSEEREPMTDVIESENEIAVTVEMPGVSKDDIDLSVKEEEIEISVDAESRKYHKRVRLPARVQPQSTKATYTNGILDLVVTKTEPGKPQGGHKVKVE